MKKISAIKSNNSEILTFLRNANSEDNFIVCAMYTDGYKDFARRLVGSLNKFEIPYSIFLIPNIHVSISTKGNIDSEFTKPNFILYCLQNFKKNILYIDIDCVVQENPLLINELNNKKVDFGIFNWLTTLDNQCFLPLKDNKRYYEFFNSIDYSSEKQLICSGAVQYWSTSSVSQCLLLEWQKTILLNPTVQDDWALDFTFNNLAVDLLQNMRVEWLPKSYCRYPWWIFDEPIIDHPEIPFIGNRSAEIKDDQGRQRVKIEELKTKNESKFLNENEIIDTEEKLIIGVKKEHFFVVKAIDNDMWI